MKKEEENKMKEIADKKNEEEQNEENQKIKMMEKQGFFKRLSPYNKPAINVLVGLVASCVQGALFPTLGLFMMRMLFSLMIPNKDAMRDETDKWCLGMFLCSVGSFLTGFLQKFMFGMIGENITYHIRQSLYAALLKKHIGWFDFKDNAPGVLTNILAADVQALNGATT